MPGRLPIVLIIAAALALPAAAAENTIEIRSLKVLVPIYRGAAGDADRLDDAAMAAIRNGCELGRLFYYRNTFGKLNLELTYMTIDRRAPENDGPTYEYIEADLRSRGVKDGQYDGVFTTGVGLKGNWGGFTVFRRAGGAFGGADRRGDLNWYPEDRPDVWYGLAWNFVHEFQHALDSPIAHRSGHPELLHGHPYADSMEGHFTWGHRGAQHWDWEAHTLRHFTSYDTVYGVTDSVITAVDTDGDGLPDDDPRLPTDEKRFGSDPTRKDTDGDGLDDMAEFTADIYRGSDPANPDTDADGLVDGQDRDPTVALAETTAYAFTEPSTDGVMDQYDIRGSDGGPSRWVTVYRPLVSSCYVHNSESLSKARIHACWSEDALYLFVETQTRCALDLLIDTSAENGFWEGGDTYPIRVTPDGKVVFSDLGLRGEVPGATAEWGAEGLEVKIPALIGQGVSHEINWGGIRRKEDTTDGMVLLAGGMISVNLALTDGRERALFTPNWSMFDVMLHKSPTDPARPSLRFTNRHTGERQPAVVVTGVGPRDRVLVVEEEGAVLGERFGDGSVILTGKLRIGRDTATGANSIRVLAGGVESEPVTLVVDREAEPPAVKLSPESGSCTISGEPGARADVYAGAGVSPVIAVGSVILDEQGRGECELPIGRGFLGEYGLGTSFDSPVFARVDQQIDFDYQADTPDPRVPADGFCVRWTGYLQVEVEGDYTFYLTTDDGSRTWIDGVQVIDNWGHHAPVEKTATVRLKKGEHHIRVDYYEDYGWASAHLEWSGPSAARTHDIPVKPLSSAVGEPVFFVRQIDPVGNVSLFTRL